MTRFRKILLIGFSSVFVAGCVSSRTPDAVTPAGHLTGMEAFDSIGAHRAAIGFLAAFDSLQWEPFHGYLAEEVTMFFPFAQFPARVDGRAAVGAIFKQFFDSQRTGRTEAGRPMVQGLALRDLRLQLAGTGAAVVTFHLGGESPSRRSLVFRRTVTGTWEVVHWHASPAPRPASQ